MTPTNCCKNVFPGRAGFALSRAILTLLLLNTIVSSPLADAQVLYGTLLGNVTDPSGNAVKGAKIIALNPATGFKGEAQTTERGTYEFHDLRPGTYELALNAPGFAEAKRSGISISANQVTRINVQLVIAASAQSVDVSAATQGLQTDSGDLHSELSAHQIENLPLNGYRNYQSLLNLVPGATPARFQNSVMDTPARSLTTNINGTSRNAIATAVDGAAIQQVYLPHHTLYNPPADAIESVNIATNSFAAEQGLAGGAVVTVITKSGTNQFHGTLFENHTNSALASRNTFYLGKSVPQNLLNQFGATLGGRIIKDKLFFFSSYEGLIQRQNYSTIITLPTNAERTGNFTGLATIYDPKTGNADGTGRTPVPGNTLLPSQINSAAAKLLTLIPQANLPGTSNNYFVGANYGLDRHSIDEKVSWQIDSKSSLFGKFSYMDAQVQAATTLGAGGGTGLSPGGGSAGSGFSHTQVSVYGFGYTRTLTPSLVVDANFGFGRNVLNWTENDYGTNYGLNVLGIPGTNGTDPRQSGLPSFAISGFETFGNTDAYTPEIKHDNVFTYAANLGWTKGAHSFRFGVQLLNNRLNEFQPQRGFGPRGGFTFSGGSTTLKGGASSTSANSFADFLLGNAATLGKSYQALDPITGVEWQDGLYAQDQWRVNNKLTVTYGIRWEYYPLLSRDTRGLERYDLTTNQVLLGGVSGISSGAGTTVNPHQFAPRAGIAYRWNEKTVLRGGYGISIDPYPYSRALRDPYPVTIAQTINGTSSYTPAGNLTTGIPAVAPINPVNGVLTLPLDAYTKTLNAGQLTRGYIESFNVTIERQLPWSSTLSAAYVGTRSIHQMAYIEANAGQTPGAGAAGQPLYVAFGRAAQTQVIIPYSTANYNSLQLNWKRRLTQGISVTSSYTYSKSIDYSTDSDSVPLFNAVAYQSRNRAVSDFDRKHVFQTGFTAELPFGKGKQFFAANPVLSAIAGGWQVSALIAAYSGLPFTPTASGTSLNAPFNTQVADVVKSSVTYPKGIGTGALWFDTSAFAPVTQARFGTAGRNTLRGPGAHDIDLGLTRRFALREWLLFDLRAEALNLTNTPSYANPSGNASSSAFGHITATAGGSADSRLIRFSGKITF